MSPYALCAVAHVLQVFSVETFCYSKAFTCILCCSTGRLPGQVKDLHKFARLVFDTTHNNIAVTNKGTVLVNKINIFISRGSKLKLFISETGLFGKCFDVILFFSLSLEL